MRTTEIGKVLLIVLLSAASNCGPDPEWRELRGSATNCVVAVFPPDTTVEIMNAFLEEHTQGPPHPGGGHLLRNGIGAVVNTTVDDQDAFQICFQPGADPVQMSTIRNEIKNSPVVERVLEGQ